MHSTYPALWEALDLQRVYSKTLVSGQPMPPAGAHGYSGGQGSLRRWDPGPTCTRLSWQAAFSFELLNIDQFQSWILIHFL